MSGPQFFATPSDLVRWFTERATTETEPFLGYWKKATGKPSVTWPAPDLRRTLVIRFTGTATAGRRRHR